MFVPSSLKISQIFLTQLKPLKGGYSVRCLNVGQVLDGNSLDQSVTSLLTTKKAFMNYQISRDCENIENKDYETLSNS